MDKQISILDCTLRDGGYCNQWEFGLQNERRIIENLIISGVEIVECGILCNQTYSSGISRFSSTDDICEILPVENRRKNTIFVCLMNVGQYDVDKLPECDGKSIVGIRVAFHKQDAKVALEACRKIKQKGYLLFVQPMVTLQYSEKELMNLIHKVNEIEPYAFYIVDSFGSMKRKDVIRLYNLVEENISNNIVIGFHSHNNLQLAFSNAQTLVELHSRHNLIIDCCIMGMGRGAGNLNTELFMQYLNGLEQVRYNVEPILYLIDDVISIFFQKKGWGYSLPNYLSAVHDVHPNYASFLAEKNTLTVHDMNDLLGLIADEKKATFDIEYISYLYKMFMTKPRVSTHHESEFKSKITGKKILIIAPGKSCMEEASLIKGFSKIRDIISISVNFEYDIFKTDYLFVSNKKRFEELPMKDQTRLIVTSNIKSSEVYMKIDYSEYLCELNGVQDNAAMMLIKYLIKQGVAEIYLAGLDGYSYDVEQNYFDDTMQLVTSKSMVDKLNQGMTEALHEFSKQCNLYFLTPQKYLNI